jgi:hypothetical protein
MFWTSSSEHIPWWLSCQLNGAVNLDSRFGEGILFAVSVLFPFSFDSSACQFRLRIARDGTKKNCTCVGMPHGWGGPWTLRKHTD